MYYDIYKTLTYNCLFNFIIGNRTAGKTFGGKTWSIKDFKKKEKYSSVEEFKKKGYQFIYLRRYDTEFDNIDKFWDDIRFKFPDDKLEVKGKDFYINDELAGYGIPLSTSKTLKSTPFPFVNKIIFDEFIIEKGVYHYLSSEIRDFLEFYNTIARPGTDHCDVIVFFMANNITMGNPYFLYFNINTPYNGNLLRKGEILIEMVNDSELIARQKATRFGSIVQDTDYEKYAFENKSMLDNKTFVMKKTERSRYSFTIKYKDNFLGIWIDYSEGKLFASNDVDSSCRIIYAMTVADHSPNTFLIKQLGKAALFKTFIEAYKQGNVYFENIKIKSMMYEVIKLCIT